VGPYADGRDGLWAFKAGTLCKSLLKQHPKKQQRPCCTRAAGALWGLPHCALQGPGGSGGLPGHAHEGPLTGAAAAAAQGGSGL